MRREFKFFQLTKTLNDFAQDIVNLLQFLRVDFENVRFASIKEFLVETRAVVFLQASLSNNRRDVNSKKAIIV